MTEPPKKEETETLEEWYSKVYDYEPTIEEVNAAHSKDFNEWCKTFLKK